MSNWLESALSWLDKRTQQGMRTAAQTQGRRNVLTKLGTWAVGGALLPMLPFDRGYGAETAGEHGAGEHTDETKCDYWAYCALDGTRCNACGGATNVCPPGSQASKVSWVGTCTNPVDKKAYLVSYNDCCGQSSCRQDARCYRQEGERPPYKISAFNDINWCMANTNKNVNCSTALIVGIADA